MKNNGLSDFLKFAYQCGKVEEIQKAFEEFPVEKERILHFLVKRFNNLNN